jgi:hypothetical protein
MTSFQAHPKVWITVIKARIYWSGSSVKLLKSHLMSLRSLNLKGTWILSGRLPLPLGTGWRGQQLKATK